MKFGPCPLSDARLEEIRSGAVPMTLREWRQYKDWVRARWRACSEAGKKSWAARRRRRKAKGPGQ